MKLLWTRGCLGLVALLAAAPAAWAQFSVGLVPPRIEKVVRPGSRIQDAIAFTNESELPVRVTVSLADFALDDANAVVERPPGTEPTTLVPYLRIAPLELRVPARQEVFFRYAVDTPADFAHLRALVFFTSEPELGPTEGRQVVFVPTMGVPIYVESLEAQPGSLEVEGVEWQRSPDDAERLRLRLVVTNAGERSLRPEGHLEVRAVADGFREAYAFNADRDVVLPGLRRTFDLEVGPVPAGELALKLRFTDSPRTSRALEHRLPAAPGR